MKPHEDLSLGLIIISYLPFIAMAGAIIWWLS